MHGALRSMVAPVSTILQPEMALSFATAVLIRKHSKKLRPEKDRVRSSGMFHNLGLVEICNLLSNDSEKITIEGLKQIWQNSNNS